MNEHEDQRLDEAIKKADDLLVGSLKQEQRHRRKIIALWIAAAFGLVLILSLGIATVLYRVEKTRQAEAAAQLANADAMKRAAERQRNATTQPGHSSGLSPEAWEQTLTSLNDD